jgi:putative ABC transport system permease protein
MSIISWSALSWCLIPIALVCAIYIAWQGRANEVLLASARMLLQLVGVGYVLVVLFENPSPWLSLAVLTVMITAAGWIAVRPVRHQSGYLQPALISLGLAVSLHLLLSLKLVMGVEQWYSPNVLIPLAGMYFANTMNAISLAAERYQSELDRSVAPLEARGQAFQAAMIPQINGLLAVGLVALPGMMTGQILSGVSPLVAVRYQIMIMAMILGTSGTGAALMLWLLSRRHAA